MGKNLIAQRSGRGTRKFRAPSFRWAGKVSYRRPAQAQTLTAVVRDLITSQGHTTPLAEIRFEDGQDSLHIAPEGLRVGDTISIGENAPVQLGNTLPLKNVPEAAEGQRSPSSPQATSTITWRRRTSTTRARRAWR